MTDKLNILFLCTGNSCRSQMAEAFARHLKGDQLTPYSAGVTATQLNPHAVTVMKELGIDMTADQSSKTMDSLLQTPIDVVVTVCSHAHETCPAFPAAARIVHHGFEDPPHLTADMPDGEEKLAVYRRVRDEIKNYILTLPDSLPAP